MHLKVFLKLKKTQKNSKKKPKKPKEKPLGWFFLNLGFFQPWQQELFAKAREAAVLQEQLQQQQMMQQLAAAGTGGAAGGGTVGFYGSSEH
jgi:hypothetical protein